MAAIVIYYLVVNAWRMVVILIQQVVMDSASQQIACQSDLLPCLKGFWICHVRLKYPEQNSQQRMVWVVFLRLFRIQANYLEYMYVNTSQ